jgi:hypothetical protein
MQFATPVRITLLSLLAATVFSTAGCGPHYYAAPPPPPPAYGGPAALIDRADHAGYRAGFDDGARDASSGFGYHPQHDRKFHDTVGYDPALGPFGPYRDYFRRAYLRGYGEAFNRR